MEKGDIRYFAAIDVGSFELELGIYEISAKTGIKRVDYIKHTIALGSDTYKYGKISYEMIDELCDVLSDFKKIMKSYRVDDYKAYATSAMREASNNMQVLDQIKVRAGIDISIISNSEQRFINYMSIDAKGELFEKYIRSGTAVADVGFGSMQLTLYDNGAIQSTQNLSLGVLRLREMVEEIDNITEKKHNVLTELIDNDLNTFKKIYLKDKKVKTIIGVGEPLMYMFKYMNRDADDMIVNYEEFIALFDKIRDKSVEEIETILGVGKNYAKMIIPSVLIFQRIFDLFNAKEIWLPGTLLIDGIAAEYAKKSNIVNTGHDFRADIIASSKSLAKRYRGNSKHTTVVEKNALMIFDAIKSLSGLSERDRLLVQIAAILHNIGKFINMKNSDVATYNIISSSEIIGISHDERMLVAEMSNIDTEESIYNKRDIRLAKLSAILQMANALDRSHKQKIKDYSLKLDDNKLILEIRYMGDLSLEMLSFNLHRDFFREIFGIEFVLKQIRTF